MTKSDYISLHVPKSKQTTDIIGITELEQMKPSAYLINCARGGIVNESDLLTALDSNLIAGAALDVFPDEPPFADNQLMNVKNLIMTPLSPPQHMRMTEH